MQEWLTRELLSALLPASVLLGPPLFAWVTEWLRSVFQRTASTFLVKGIRWWHCSVSIPAMSFCCTYSKIPAFTMLRSVRIGLGLSPWLFSPCCPCLRHSSLHPPASPPTLHMVLCNWWFLYLLNSFFGPSHSCFLFILQISAQMAPLCATLDHINLHAEILMALSTFGNLVCFWLPLPPRYKDQISVPLKTEALLPLALRAHHGTEWCPWTLSEWMVRSCNGRGLLQGQTLALLLSHVVATYDR